MKSFCLSALALATLSFTAGGQEAAREPQPDKTYKSASDTIHEDLKSSLAELSELREQLMAEKLPLADKLARFESELSEARKEYQAAARLLDVRSLDLSTLQSEIDAREAESQYISNLLGEYVRNFESRLHIVEVERYSEPLEQAKLAPENANLDEIEVFAQQTGLLDVALDRVEDSLGGSRFEGWAVDSRGLLQNGTIVLVGPAALFVSNNGRIIGAAESRLGSLEPAVIPFGKPEDSTAASDLVLNGGGYLPIDPTLGNAHLVEETQESLVEHVKNGGAVMIPILGMATLALLVALYKWLAILFTPKPSMRKIGALLDAVGEKDQEKIHAQARRIRGPVGRMLTAGVEHLREPRELIEEVMYETVLTTKLKLQSFLPFIAICAASAPLLGLLGTVTGIINTFKLITVFGSGDVKSLSGGISEALITTKFGLIVAIPSLLIHAFLSRSAKTITDRMEKAAVAFINQVMRTRSQEPEARTQELTAYDVPTTGADRELVREQVNEVLKDLLGPEATRRVDEELATTPPA